MARTPSEKDCGACGARTCAEFGLLVREGKKRPEECPFREREGAGEQAALSRAVHTGFDMLGREYDFLLAPLPGEVSARKIVLPFRPDLVERWGIGPGDVVIGRPMGQGCPVQHVLLVEESDIVTGVLTCHTVGPLFAREKDSHDIRAYNVIGFEGRAVVGRRAPVFGLRQRFLPGACMMNLSHTGVVNMVLSKESGIHVRLEDIRI